MESARTGKSKMLPPLREEFDGFDVTCIIGRVEPGNGDLRPHEAAMLLIARHDAEGQYSFPMSLGGTQHVTVEFEAPVER